MGSPVRAAAGAARSVPPDVRRQLIGAGVLALLCAGLLLAVPGLRPVVDEIAAIDPAWLLVAVALELGSCVSFVVAYRWFFDAVAPGAARTLAWTSMAAGVLLPAGGAGGLLIAGWLARVMGHETGWIIRRSSALFVFTSAVNIATLVAAGCLALTGLSGPGDLLRAGLPELAGCTTIALLAAVARRQPARRELTGEPRLAALLAGAGDAARLLLRPPWRLAGAVGYLWFDIAVLWAALRAVGAAPPVAALVLGYLIGYLANALPVPAGIGVLDAGLTGALTVYGVPAVHAAAAVLVYHAVVVWVPGSGGLAAFAAAQRPGGAVRRAARAREERYG